MLKLIVRRSAFASNGLTTAEDEDVVNQVECAAIAAMVVEGYLKIPPELPRYTFPLIHYLTTATMIMVSIVLKNPALKKICRKPIVLGVNALIADCPKTWVSGKIMRTISRLTKMVQSGLLNDTNDMTLHQTHSENSEQIATRRPLNMINQVTSSSMSLPSPHSISTMAVVGAATYPGTDQPLAHQSSPSQSSFQRLAAGNSPSTGTGSRYVPTTRSLTPNAAASVVHGGPEDDNELFSTNALAFIDLPEWVFSDFEFEGGTNLSYNEVTGVNGAQYHEGDVWWNPENIEDIMPFHFPPA